VSFAALDRAVLTTVLERLDDLRATEFFRRWNEQPIGELSLADIFEYRFAETFYAEEWRRLAPLADPVLPRPSWTARARATVQKGQWDRRMLYGVLESLAPAGIRAYERSRAGEKYVPADVLVAGFLNRSGPLFGSALRELEQAGFGTAVLDPSRIAIRRAETLEKVVRRETKDGAVGFPYGSVHPWHGLRRLAAAIFTLEDIFAKCPPRLLLVPDERLPVARGMAALAQRWNVPCLSVGHKHELLLGRVPYLSPAFSRSITVSHSVQAAALNRLGRCPTPIHVAPFAEEALAAPRLGVPQVPAEFLYCAQARNFEAGHIRALAAAIARHRDLRGTRFLVRRHGVQSAGWVRRELPGIEAAADEPLGEAMGRCTAVVTHSSSVGWEAFHAGRPVVVYNPGGVPELLPLLTKPGVSWAPTAQAAAEALARWRQAPPPAPPPPESAPSLGRVLLGELRRELTLDGYSIFREVVEPFVSLPKV